MSHRQQVFQTLLSFFVLVGNVLGQESCTISPSRQGQCINLPQCDPYYKIFEKKLIDDHVRSHLKTAICRYEGKTPVVCCERDAGHCITAENKPGACMPLRRCEPLLNYIDTRNFEQTVVNYLKASECTFGSSNQARICCPIFSHPITGQISKSSGTLGTGQQGTTAKPTRRPLTFPQPGEGEGSCGTQETEPRIIGGNVTEIDQYPWAVLLRYGNGEFSCGGSLIHPRYILTAAHCVSGPQVSEKKNVVSIRLGEHDLSKDDDWNADNTVQADPVVDIDVEEIIHHPQFSLTTLRFDIAVIRLKTPAPYSDFIRPICLPAASSEVPTNVNLTVVGWGRTETKFQSDVKLYVHLPFYNFAECAKMYVKSNVNLGDGQFCAGGQIDKDSCQGDSGGPLMYFEKVNRVGAVFYQAGVVSFGPKFCGFTGLPAVYSKVAYFLPWIKENTYE